MKHIYVTVEEYGDGTPENRYFYRSEVYNGRERVAICCHRHTDYWQAVGCCKKLAKVFGGVPEYMGA
jgi:hypothetical protein